MPTPPLASLRLLTVEEVAARLRVSKTTVYRLVERRRIPFFKYGNAVRIAEADVRAYLRAHRVEPVGSSQPYVRTKNP